MRSIGSTGTVASIILAIMLLSSGSIVYSSISRTTFHPQEIENKANEIIDEMISYLTIMDVYVKFDENSTKLLILVKPLFDGTISISNLSLQILDGKSLYIKEVGGVYASSGDLFSGKFWINMGDSFSIIPIVDRDRSIFNNMTVNGDTFYIASTLHNIKKGDHISISIINEEGMLSGLDIDIPFTLSEVEKIY